MSYQQKQNNKIALSNNADKKIQTFDHKRNIFIWIVKGTIR